MVLKLLTWTSYGEKTLAPLERAPSNISKTAEFERDFSKANNVIAAQGHQILQMFV